ncbi:helix-turn-helix transcriptional regulator [Marinomonas sp. THO17]|uniref:helix-turn-helix transcriptional regulator n=1 Tax=Marinomonas sp. THO17 TaxID=3149048 RepID=UPI00336BD550
MKMKDQLDSPQPMKKPKVKSKKAEVKKKKQAKLKAKKEEKAKKADKEKKSAVKNTTASHKKNKKAKPSQATPQDKPLLTTTNTPVINDKDAPAIEVVDHTAEPIQVDKNLATSANETTSTNETSSPRRTVRRSRRKPTVEDIQALVDNANRQRASKNLAALTEQEQSIATQDIVRRLLTGDISQGKALRELRVKVLGLRQEAYTELTGVSRKTLSEVENDKGNYTAEIINKMFKPFQLKVSLVPTSSDDLKAILNQK